MSTRASRFLPAALCAALLTLSVAAPVWADAPEPDFVYVPAPQQAPPPAPPPPLIPPPTSKFNGPCGLAVDSGGRFYVADYYHRAIDVFTPPPGPYPTATPPFFNNYLDATEIFPLDGPCGLAIGASENIYANNYHRDVTRFGPRTSFGTGLLLDSDHPTGVAVDPATDDVYVDARDRVSVYDSANNPTGTVGLGTLTDGYGVAVSGYGPTAGFVYVADADDDTVKVYDPATDPVNPDHVIDGADTPEDEFVSLRDSEIAVDDATGEVYVLDNLQPAFTEEPQGIVYVFDAAGAYQGHLKYNVVHGEPSGLAVDNSGGADQGRVYVTSGNTDQAGVYAYPPGSAVTSVPEPPTIPLGVSTAGTGGGEVFVDLAEASCESSCEVGIRSGATATLTAIPDEGSQFDGWTGAGCEGTGACTIEMSEAKAVSAEFEGAVPADGDAPDPTPSSGSSTDPTRETSEASAALTVRRALLRKRRAIARRRAVLRKRRVIARRRALRRRRAIHRRAILRRRAGIRRHRRAGARRPGAAARRAGNRGRTPRWRPR